MQETNAFCFPATHTRTQEADLRESRGFCVSGKQISGGDLALGTNRHSKLLNATYEVLDAYTNLPS
jgi:hypothetical protein